MEFNPVLTGTLAVLNIPVYYLIYRIMFNDWDEFAESLRFWLTPDVFSLFRGEYWDDWYAEFKLGVWFLGCISAVALEHLLLLPLLTK